MPAHVGKTSPVSDARQREQERRALVDPEAALAAGVSARRAGRTSEALDWFERAWLAGQTSAADPFVELVESVSPDDRARHVPHLVRLERGAVREAGALWRGWFPVAARLVAADPVDALPWAAGVLDFVLQHAHSIAPVRLAGTCDPSQELVARAIVELSARQNVFTQAEEFSPDLELAVLQHHHGESPYDALFLYHQSASHYSRLLERLLAFCSERGIRAILGIRLDAWDGDRFPPFAEGVELVVPPLR